MPKTPFVTLFLRPDRFKSHFPRLIEYWFWIIMQNRIGDKMQKNITRMWSLTAEDH